VMWILNVLALSLSTTSTSTARMNLTLPFTPTGNYFEVPGSWVGDDQGGAYGPQPSVDGRRDLDLDTDGSYEGYLDADTMMQICDKRPGCDSFGVAAHAQSSIEFFKRDSDKTAYIHRFRCADGIAVNTTAPMTGGIYKMCKSTNWAAAALGSFKLPPFLCQQSCDHNEKCQAFTVDAAGNNCWLSYYPTDVSNTYYIKVRS